MDDLIRNAVKNLIVGRVRVIIVHRLATAREYRIIVIEEGAVEESERFDELLKRRGKYYILYISQICKSIYGKLIQEGYIDYIR